MSLLLCSFCIYSELLPLFLQVSGLWSCGHCISFRVAMYIKIYFNTCPFFFVPSVYTLNFSPCSFQSLGFGLVVTVFLIKWQCLLRYICEYLSPLLCSFYIYSKLLSLFHLVSGLWSCGHYISYIDTTFINIYVNTYL